MEFAEGVEAADARVRAAMDGPVRLDVAYLARNRAR